jgi:hypothetical protein
VLAAHVAVPGPVGLGARRGKAGGCGPDRWPARRGGSCAPPARETATGVLSVHRLARYAKRVGDPFPGPAIFPGGLYLQGFQLLQHLAQGGDSRQPDLWVAMAGGFGERYCLGHVCQPTLTNRFVNQG